MTRARFHTDYRLWTLTAVCLFVALGFVDPLAGAWGKGDASLWHQVGDVVRGEYAMGVRHALPSILLYAGLLCVPAVLIGWVVQATIVIVWPPRGGQQQDAGRKLCKDVRVDRSAPTDRPRD